MQSSVGVVYMFVGKTVDRVVDGAADGSSAEVVGRSEGGMSVASAAFGKFS